MLFQDVDFLDRFEAASKAGFKGVEYLFPYAYPKEQLAERLKKYKLTQALHNLPAGNWAAGERGIACHPDRIGEFQDGVGKAIEYANALGCKQVNCLAGLAPKGVPIEKAHATFVSNVKFAAAALEKAGVQLIIEAINTQDMQGFFLNTTKQARAIIQEVNSKNLGYQYDIYHMQIMEGNLARTIKDNIDIIKHIQVADTPGRHEPGTGEINYPFIFKYLDDVGYKGWIGCEYVPAGKTVDGLGWVKPYLR
jgi:hydroxypyruvate isomerase